jgi:hypothetical protein
MEFVVELIQARLHESAVIEEYCRRTQRVITNDLHLTPAVRALREEVNELCRNTTYTDMKITQWLYSTLPKEQYKQIIDKWNQYASEQSKADSLPANILTLIRNRQLEAPAPDDFLLG